MIETKFQLLRKTIELFNRNRFTRKISQTLYGRTLSFLFSNRGPNSYSYKLKVLGTSFKLHANWLDYTDARILLEPVYEEPTSKFLFDHIKDGESFVNLGSNIGYFPMFIASLGRNNKIVSVEISSRNTVLQKRSIAENNFTNIELFEGGVSDINDTVDFKQILMNSGSGSIENYFGISGKEKDFIYISEKKPVISLETLLSQHNMKTIDYILLDIQGSEDKVIRSSLDLIKNKVLKNIIIEYTNTEECDELFRFMMSNDLKMFAIDRYGKTHPMNDLTNAVHGSNYLFIH